MNHPSIADIGRQSNVVVFVCMYECEKIELRNGLKKFTHVLFSNFNLDRYLPDFINVYDTNRYTKVHRLFPSRKDAIVESMVVWYRMRTLIELTVTSMHC